MTILSRSLFPPPLSQLLGQMHASQFSIMLYLASSAANFPGGRKMQVCRLAYVVFLTGRSVQRTARHSAPIDVVADEREQADRSV
jgi:hypothetical protein